MHWPRGQKVWSRSHGTKTVTVAIVTIHCLVTAHLPWPVSRHLEQPSWWCHICHIFTSISSNTESTFISTVTPRHWLSPWKRGNVFTGVGIVCLSVTTITNKIVDEFVLNFLGRFLGGKGRPSSCFVTIGRGMWKQRSKNSINRRLFTFYTWTLNHIRKRQRNGQKIGDCFRGDLYSIRVLSIWFCNCFAVKCTVWFLLRTLLIVSNLMTCNGWCV